MIIKLNLLYEGTNYAGWQRQKNAVAVQNVLENVLSGLYREQVLTVGSGRTDSGVHAAEQIAVFNIKKNKIPTAKLPAVLNRQLPSDIRIKKAETVTGANFHPRYSARVRQYRYILLKHLKNRYNADLFLNRFSWHPGIELDKKTVTQLLRPLTGIHDFTTFCAADDSSAVKLREIFKIEVKQKPGALFIDIYGNAFLKAMVRSIIGNMIHTIKNNKPGTYLKHILLKQDRRLAKQRAPACGLTLMRVYYRKIFGERDYYKRT